MLRFNQLPQTRIAFLSLIRAYSKRSSLSEKDCQTHRSWDAKIAIVFFVSAVENMIDHISKCFIDEYGEKISHNDTKVPNLTDDELIFIGRKKNDDGNINDIDTETELKKLPNLFRKRGLLRKISKTEWNDYWKKVCYFHNYQELRNHIIHGSLKKYNLDLKRLREILCKKVIGSNIFDDPEKLINKAYEISKNTITLIQSFCKICMPGLNDNDWELGFNYLEILFSEYYPDQEIPELLIKELKNDFNESELSKYTKI